MQLLGKKMVIGYHHKKDSREMCQACALVYAGWRTDTDPLEPIHAGDEKAQHVCDRCRYVIEHAGELVICPHCQHLHTRGGQHHV